jgi:Spy/CpxP family protein refolding chaperone
MKKVLLALLFLTNFVAATFAQDAAAATPAAPPAKKPKFEWNAETMNSAGIAADVQTKILDLTKAADAESKKIRKDKAIGDEDKKVQIKAIKDKCEKDIQALLTPEQKKKIGAIRKELKAKAQG